MSLFKSIWKDAEHEIKSGNIVATIILINIAIYVAVNLIPLFPMIAGYSAEEAAGIKDNIIQWLAIPYDLKSLLYRPWTVITHMFLHSQFGHIFWNMLIFYWFARILKLYVNEKKLLPLYIYGGLMGASLSLLLFNLAPQLTILTGGSFALGASAGVMAIVLAAATLVPDHSIYLLFLGQVKIKYIAVAALLLDIIALGSFNNFGGHIAHLGGAGFGYFFIKQLQNGNDMSIGFNNLMNGIVGWFKPSEKSNVKVVYKSKEKTRSRKKLIKIRKQNIDHQTRVDQILDKISQSGYDSLSKEDKDFLFKVSNEDKPLSD